MVGIAWEGDTNTDPLEDAALQSACEYLLPIITKYEIPLWNIVRHADVAPGRKIDCSIVAARKLRDTITKYG
jgi:N-acetyl-anhydromuramyl-L-alanine amidase AmpD